ncbi:MAG TPA: hypothetical protein VKX31_03590 [Brumimicrobium sp.]|nr:hypothetical protein [Brumimicrobium sp.]
MNKIQKYHLVVLVFFISTLGISQSQDLGAPAQYENTYLFEILRYQREPNLPDYIKNGFDEALKTPMTKWTAKDSLFFAYANVYLGKHEKALNNFVRLTTDTISEKTAQTLYRTALFKTEKYEQLQTFNQRTINESTPQFYSIKNAFTDLTHAYINYQNSNFSDSSWVFPVLKDSVLKTFKHDVEPHKNRLVEVAFAIDSAFRQFTILHEETDFVLSKAFEEMGDFQKEYLYITNAYFYYSAALRYNKGNKSVISKYNQTNNEIRRKGYLHISFKNMFGKVIKNRYQLKENFIEKPSQPILSEENFIPPTAKKEKKDYLPWLDTTALFMIIISGALIFVMLFLKTNNKHR